MYKRQPVIVSADGEIQNVINKAGAGTCSDAGDAKSLARNIQKLINLPKDELASMSINAVRYYKANFDKETLLNRMDRWFVNS